MYELGYENSRSKAVHRSCKVSHNENVPHSKLHPFCTCIVKKHHVQMGSSLHCNSIMLLSSFWQKFIYCWCLWKNQTKFTRTKCLERYTKQCWGKSLSHVLFCFSYYFLLLYVMNVYWYMITIWKQIFYSLINRSLLNHTQYSISSNN